MDPITLGDLTCELFLAHPFPEILKGSPLAIGHSMGVVLDQVRLPQQEALQCVALYATAVEKRRHGRAAEEREIASKEHPVKARQGSLDLVGVLGDELFHGLIAHQTSGDCKLPIEDHAATDLVAAARPR